MKTRRCVYSFKALISTHITKNQASMIPLKEASKTLVTNPKETETYKYMTRTPNNCLKGRRDKGE
jgi:hypothetical protein